MGGPPYCLVLVDPYRGRWPPVRWPAVLARYLLTPGRYGYIEALREEESTGP